MLTGNSVAQVLRVIDSCLELRTDGALLEEAAIEAMKMIAKQDRLEDRTIRDACWRRLGLRSIREFYQLLAALERDNAELLASQLMRHSEPAAHDEIDRFFARLRVGRR